MSNKVIKYIGFYDTLLNKKENRNSALAATNKMDYIVKALNINNYKVNLISPSWTVNKKYYKGRTIDLSDECCLKLFPTLPWISNIGKMLSVIFSFMCLLNYILINVKQNEQIIVYHSKWLSLPIIIAKKIRKSMVVILEVEEIYDDVSHSKIWHKIEYKLFKVVDKFIFPTELLNQKLNVENKPYSIIYGTYNVEEDRKCKFDDGRIHVVYAGTFDPRKGGATAAAIAAAYLPHNYHVHILGFGSKDDTNMLVKKIDEISIKAEAIITYEGLLSGEEYTHFLQKCDIGLSTQIPDAIYNESSFPSKILSYMANGLRVVSVRIKVIEISAIGNSVYYYEKQTPQSIAKAIMSINIKEPYNGKRLIKELNDDFVKQLDSLLRC